MGWSKGAPNGVLTQGERTRAPLRDRAKAGWNGAAEHECAEGMLCLRSDLSRYASRQYSDQWRELRAQQHKLEREQRPPRVDSVGCSAATQ